MRVVILLFLLTACGSPEPETTVDLKQQCDPDSDFTNGWINQDLDRLLLGPDCFGRTEDVCQHRFKYYKPVNNQITIEVNSAEGYDSCLPMGKIVCTFIHLDPNGVNEELQINCGDGIMIYFAESTL